ncbi:unnamed protein product [Bemisia tabaci]|uniref:Gamma-secretase-activating protein C-terminal domain-containing protein n=1 Tax=Bemisia tabaci TaxID=7038 RepID=A0A9P0AE93_BEMTA|nr:unnamed protein product [Bemisia tabaci]
MTKCMRNIQNLKTYVSTLICDDDFQKFKLLGQELGGNLLISWLHYDEHQNPVTSIGLLHSENNQLKSVCTFQGKINLIQASITFNKSFISFVTKEVRNSGRTSDEEIQDVSSDSNSAEKQQYSAFCFKLDEDSAVARTLDDSALILPSQSRQTFVQFLYRQKQPTTSERLLVFTHREAASIYVVDSENSSHEVVSLKLSELLVQSFIWIQWDHDSQTLYYISHRKAPKFDNGTASNAPITHKQEVPPILSALQFHDDLPFETVLNIPFTLPDQVNFIPPCNTYKDNPIPLRISDCSLNISVVSNPIGAVAICHHYVYQPVTSSCDKAPIELKSDSEVYLAYSIILLHHGKLMHCDISDIPWTVASSVHPVFSMQEDQYVIVYAPNLFIHLLDVGLHHEPCCHIMLPVVNAQESSSSQQLSVLSGNVIIDCETFNIIDLPMSTSVLEQFFKSPDTTVFNKISILHYFLVHTNSLDVISRLLDTMVSNILDINITKMLQEILIGGTYSAVGRNLSTDALPLTKLLPLTTNQTGSLKFFLPGEHSVIITYEALNDPSVMLLSPSQRVVPYRGDMWTRLWDAIPVNPVSRFKPSTVVDKLTVSLVCYQPEALSRCCTPLSPGTAMVGASGTLTDFAQMSGNLRSNSKVGIDPLPFFEVKSSAASKQEHVISVNLRELSMYLLKNFKVSGSFRIRECPMQVHAVATRYAACQLDLSRFVCSSLTKASAVNTYVDRGLSLIDSMKPAHRSVFFIVLERYALAVEQLAYPFPEGFPSFFTYLGYKSLTPGMFLQYVRANVLELNVDVMKVIMADLPNSANELAMKLRLLTLLPRSRAKRLLNQWHHPISLMLRAREHSLNVLSGVQLSQMHQYSHKKLNFTPGKGLQVLASHDKSSPLDTFFDLLTAKANLADLDFNLLIEATLASLHDL